MARKARTTADDATMDTTPGAAANGDGGERVKIALGMRPVYNEVARLSATLGVARKACYDGDPGRAARALSLLAKQLPLAQEMADLLAPAE